MARVSEVREVRGLIEISLDGVLWLRIKKKHFAKHPLENDAQIEAEEYISSLAAVQAADCYEAALCMLDRAAQTGGNMIQKLILKGYVRPAAEATVERLKENHLIDDRRFAERIAQSSSTKPVGAYAVQRKLRAKRLPQEVIDEAMQCFDADQQAEACRNAAKGLYRRYASLPPREARAKLSQALSRRGFGWDSISAAVDDIINGNDFDEY